MFNCKIWIHTWSGGMPITDDFPPPPAVLLLLLCFLLSWGGTVLCSRSLKALTLSLVPVRRLSRLITRPRSLRIPSAYSGGTTHNYTENKHKHGCWSARALISLFFQTQMNLHILFLPQRPAVQIKLDACVSQEVWKQKCGCVFGSSFVPREEITSRPR